MDTMLCPFCGKEIDASAESCEYCSQPLPLGDADALAKAAETLTAKNTAELEAELPDWLKEARQGEEAEDAAENADEDVDPLAWLDELNAEDDDEEDADWLVNLQEETAPQENEETEENEEKQDVKTEENVVQEAETEEELGGIAQVLADDAPEEKIEAGELPEWLSNLQGETLSDELEELPDLVGEEAAQAETDGDAPEDELIAGGDLPDWLSADADKAAPQADGALEAADLPDWMTASAAEEVTEAVERVEEAAEAELPEWLSAEGEGDAATTNDTEQAVDAAEDLPDWISELKPAEGETEESAQVVGEAAELLSETNVVDEQASAQAFDSSEETGDAEAVSAELPDWLSQIEQTNRPEEIDEVEKEDAEAATFSAETPDWLEDLPAVKMEEGVELPEPSNENEATDAFSGGIEDTEEIFGIEMPDWLSSLSPEEMEEERGTAEERAEGTEVSGVELPSWVQAMRPVEDVVANAADDSDDVVADTGPLAGLSGILPAAANCGQISKPKAHALKLQVSESQQNGAAMLEELLASESKAVSAGKSSDAASLPLLRWAIALLLFLAVGFSLFSGSEVVSLPESNVPEVQDTADTINRLAAGENVLLVFDYEAGFSGEMEAVAAPLVEQLLSRGEKITVLSTLPMGASLAENFLAETQAKYEFQTGVNYRNLGYLAGGTSGILSFISNPRQALAMQENGVSVWEIAPLDSVQQISDFALVVVLTDDAERGRFWVEQAAKPLDAAGSSLVMAVSAQAEPMLYPYYASGQLDGLVSGLSGGASYEQIQNQRGLGRKYWDAYGLGLLLAEILIAFGAMINFLAALNARRKEEKEEN